METKQELMKILNVPIYPHEQANPTEAVADYLLDNDVVPVVRCKNCKHFRHNLENDTYCGCAGGLTDPKDDDFCSMGERMVTDNA